MFKLLKNPSPSNVLHYSNNCFTLRIFKTNVNAAVFCPYISQRNNYFEGKPVRLKITAENSRRFELLIETKLLVTARATYTRKHTDTYTNTEMNKQE